MRWWDRTWAKSQNRCHNHRSHHRWNCRHQYHNHCQDFLEGMQPKRKHAEPTIYWHSTVDQTYVVSSLTERFVPHVGRGWTARECISGLCHLLNEKITRCIYACELKVHAILKLFSATCRALVDSTGWIAVHGWSMLVLNMHCGAEGYHQPQTEWRQNGDGEKRKGKTVSIKWYNIHTYVTGN